MAKYTTELRVICKSFSTDVMNAEQIIDNAIPKIFNFHYPIFDESYKGVLEKKIILHNYTREIAHETYSLWKLKLKTKLNEIMPYYNQLYESELLEFNPFYDTELTRTSERSGDEVGEITGERIGSRDGTDKSVLTGTQNSNSNLFDKYSDTPQGAIANLENGLYLTNARQVQDTDSLTTNNITNNTSSGNDKVNTDNKSTVKSLEDFLESVKGKQGGKSYSELLKEYRKTFINIDLMVIGELGELFFTLW